MDALKKINILDNWSRSDLISLFSVLISIVIFKLNDRRIKKEKEKKESEKLNAGIEEFRNDLADKILEISNYNTKYKQEFKDIENRIAKKNSTDYSAKQVVSDLKVLLEFKSILLKYDRFNDVKEARVDKKIIDIIFWVDCYVNDLVKAESSSEKEHKGQSFSDYSMKVYSFYSIILSIIEDYELLRKEDIEEHYKYVLSSINYLNK